MPGAPREARNIRVPARVPHGCGGDYNDGSLLRDCIFNEPGVFPASGGRNAMRFVNASQRGKPALFTKRSRFHE
jgi:hypothetical protein